MKSLLVAGAQLSFLIAFAYNAVTVYNRVTGHPLQVYLFRVLRHDDPDLLRYAFTLSQLLCLVMAVPSAVLIYTVSRRRGCEESKPVFVDELFPPYSAPRRWNGFRGATAPTSVAAPRSGAAPLAAKQVWLLRTARAAHVTGLVMLTLLHTTHTYHLFQELRTRDFVEFCPGTCLLLGLTAVAAMFAIGVMCRPPAACARHTSEEDEDEEEDEADVAAEAAAAAAEIAAANKKQPTKHQQQKHQQQQQRPKTAIANANAAPTAGALRERKGTSTGADSKRGKKHNIPAKAEGSGTRAVGASGDSDDTDGDDGVKGSSGGDSDCGSGSDSEFDAFTDGVVSLAREIRAEHAAARAAAAASTAPAAGASAAEADSDYAD